MATWFQERQQLFAQELQDWGTLIVYNGSSAPCIAPPQEMIKKMTEGGYSAQRPALFDLLRADFLRLKLDVVAMLKTGKRPTIGHRGYNFEVEALIDDDQEPTVQLQAYLKQ